VRLWQLSPPVLVVFRSVLCILCFSIALSRKSPGVGSYSVLGQDDSIETKKSRKGPARWEMGPTMRLEGGAAWSPFLLPRDSSC
jgi:hypothetical protein